MRRSARQPTAFFGHGSPMNAIEDNVFTKAMADFSAWLPEEPRAVLMISAHWETAGTKLLISSAPPTIHDFRGFPQALFDVRYPAPGAVFLADRFQERLAAGSFEVTDRWGLDHGAWSVLIKMFPQAHIPVAQLSLDRGKSALEHLKLASQLRFLRDEGVLILASGNIVHNLSTLNWREPNIRPFEWASAFDDKVKEALLVKDQERLASFLVDEAVETRLAIPSAEHFLPLLYAFGAADEEDRVAFPVEGFQNGSISMRSVAFGQGPRWKNTP